MGSRLKPIPPSAEIVFLSNRDMPAGSYRKEIYAMDGDGSDVTRISTTNDHHYLVGVERSGRYAVVARADEDTARPKGLGDEDRRNLWLLDLETGEERCLTPKTNLAEGDSFSPDGIRVVFFMQPEKGVQADIYTIRRDGTGLENLTNTKDGTEADPAWSNDGKRIAYILLDAKTKRFALKVMDADGSNSRVVYDARGSASTTRFPAGAYDPSWSPDDEWIVFSTPVRDGAENGGAGIWHICTIRPDGTGFKDLSEAGGHAERAEYVPRFSRDGKRILFNARYVPEGGDGIEVDIFTMDGDGGSLGRLTSSPSVDDGAAWLRP